MSQMKLQRFDANHLRDFRAPITVNTAAIVEPEAPPPPPPPVFRESDIEAAREVGKKMGYAEGFEAGLAQANTEAHHAARDLAHHMGRIQEQVASLIARYNDVVLQQSSELSQLVLMIARKVAGAALDANSAQAIAELVNRCLPIVYGKPRVVIELEPAMRNAVEASLRNQLAQGGFEGDVEFRSVDGMDPSDVRIDWGAGAANRDTNAIWGEIEALLQQVPLTPTLPTNESTTTHNDPIVETGEANG